MKMNNTMTIQKTSPLFFSISAASIALAVLCSFVLIAPPADAVTVKYNRNNLISNKDLEQNSITSKQLNNWFRKKGSVLADHKIVDRTGTLRRVSKVIVDAATRFNLNAKMFVVMAQKESGAVTASTMNSHIEYRLLGYGVCDSCSPSDYAQYEGMARQIDGAAAQFREGYLEDLENRGQTISGWAVGRSKQTLDGLTVTPKNEATASLYTYNPYVGAYDGGDSRWGGNSLFQKLWQEYTDLGYDLGQIIRPPEGSLVQAPSGAVFLIQNGTKRGFTSRGSFIANYDPRDIIPVENDVLDDFDEGATIDFPLYSLLEDENETRYLIVNHTTIRPFKGPKAFRSFGYNEAEIITVSSDDLVGFTIGQEITAQEKYTTSTLLQAPSGAVYYVNENKKAQPIIDRAILDNNFVNKNIQPASDAELNSLDSGQPLKLKDGTLATSPGTSSVYVIANGRKRPFDSAKTFETYGYSWDNIQHVSDSVLNLHSQGKRITLNPKNIK